MKKKFLNIGIGVAILTIAIFTSFTFMGNKKQPDRNEHAVSILYVQTEITKNTEQEVEVKFNGKVSSFENISITPEVSGKILKTGTPLKEGQSFRKGDLLVSIYNEDFKANLYSQRSNFLYSLSSILPDLEIDYPNEFQKWKNYFDKIDIESKLPELPEITNDKEQIFLASKQIISTYYNIKQSEITLSKYRIYAPFSGSYKSVNKQVGSIASMNMDIAAISRTDYLEIVVPVTPETSKLISKNQEVLIYDNQQNPYTGTVLRVANFINQTNQMVNVYIKYIPKTDERLLEGEYVEVIFSKDNLIEGIKIPREALLDDNNVYVLENNHLIETPVVVEFTMDDYVLISGIEEGKTIVIETLVNVTEDTFVESL